MRSYKIEGIIIKRAISGEADRIITVMTKTQGKIRINAVGVRKISSRRSSHVELLNHVNMTLYKAKQLPILTEIVTLDNFSGIKSDLKKVGFAYHVCELIDSLCPENQENRQIYDSLLVLLTESFMKQSVGVDVGSFQTRLLTLLGYWPEDKRLTPVQSSHVIENILERKLKARQILPQLL